MFQMIRCETKIEMCLTLTSESSIRLEPRTETVCVVASQKLLDERNKVLDKVIRVRYKDDALFENLETQDRLVR